MDNKTVIFQQWIDDYSATLLNNAHFLLSNKQDAEDLVQDVFLAAYESYTSFKGESTILTWLNKILKNKVADFYRKKYRKVDSIRLDHFFDEQGSWIDKNVLENWDNTDAQLLDNQSFNKTLEDCIGQLPPKWMIPVKLYYLDEKKTDKVCQETGLSTTNLWKILQRSRLQLRECLDFNWFNQKK